MVVVLRQGGCEMKKLAIAMMLLSTSAMADMGAGPSQANTVGQPSCMPIGKTDKGDLIYSMDCQSVQMTPPAGNTLVHPPAGLPPSQPSGVPQTGSKSDSANVCS